jgi:hypothetical protein
VNLPQPLNDRLPIDQKLAIGSSLTKPKELFSGVLSLFIVSELRSSLAYSKQVGQKIHISDDINTKLKDYYSDVPGYTDSAIDEICETSPLCKMALEPLHVSLQVFWKIAKIKIVDSDTLSDERSDSRNPKELSFTTNLDLVLAMLSDDNNRLLPNSKHLIYCWLTSKTTPANLSGIEEKLKKFINVFTEETAYQIWNDTEPVIFQQEGIYKAFENQKTVNHRGTTNKERKGTMRNLWSIFNKKLHPFLKIATNNDELELISEDIVEEFNEYHNRVSNYLDLVPKSFKLIPIVENADVTLNLSKFMNNKIFYGAPGTGKSHKLNDIYDDYPPEQRERITFHPDFDYASFVGGYKPVSDENDVIKYVFVPQSFAKMYVKAWKGLKEDKEFILAIEEINRGNCSEIFGDIFQLLDRNSDYTVTPSDEFNKYLLKEFKAEGGSEAPGLVDGLKLPDNLKIYATMNTSDQSLFPMDSAFKRRWDWEYVPICYEPITAEGEENKSFKFKVYLDDNRFFKWNDFISVVNKEKIEENDTLGMDKSVGNYFIKPEEENKISLEAFINKVLFYLWNDVFKDEKESIFEDKEVYERFFPIRDEGLKRVEAMLDRLSIKIHSAETEEIEEQQDEAIN